MNSGVLSGLVTGLMLIAFLGAWIWAWSGKRKAEFDAAALLPLEEHDSETPR